MNALLDQVRQAIRHYDLAGPATRVVIALSGGPDSVALTYLLRALEAAADLRVAGLAHFNHQLRAAAQDDERFCRELAASLGWPILVDGEDVGARARRERRSLEDAARTARHEFLERARGELGADVIALGHTRDDQAETFLLRLLRGAGARGLGAMHPRRGAIIRPLIDVRRQDLRAYLDAQHIAYVHDESNDDVRIPRNRVRVELLPLLERRFNPSIVDVLAEEAAVARDEWRWLEEQAESLALRICSGEGKTLQIQAEALNAAPPALARAVVRRVMLRAPGGRSVAFRHVERLLALSRADGVPFDAPGQRVERIADRVVLTSRGPTGGRHATTSEVSPFCYRLPVPGAVELPEAGWAVAAEELATADLAGFTAGRATVRSDLTAVLRLDACRAPFSVRNRRPGDSFRPLGLGGRKKLQDFFVDRKVDRCRRDAVPLVVDDDDRIMWVAGHAIDEEFRVTDPAQAVLILRLMVLGGPA